MMGKNKNIKRIFNSKGQSYLEFLLGFIVFFTIFYCFIQFYFLIRTETEMMNVARRAMRQVEAYGGVVHSKAIWQYGVQMLESYSNVRDGSVKMYFVVTPTATAAGPGLGTPVVIDASSMDDYTWMQLRDDIKVVVSCDYFFATYLKLPLSVKYAGTSQRLRKVGEKVQEQGASASSGAVGHDDNPLIYKEVNQ